MILLEPIENLLHEHLLRLVLGGEFTARSGGWQFAASPCCPSDCRFEQAVHEDDDSHDRRRDAGDQHGAGGNVEARINTIA